MTLMPHIIALRTRILPGIAALLAGTCVERAQAQADPTVFDPPVYFGTNERPQSGDTAKELLQEYELARQFNGAERYRRVGAAVGNLHLLVENADGVRRTKYCTASLVSNDRILTNYHCAPGDDGWNPVAALLNLGFLQRNEMNGEFFRVQLPPVEANKELDYSVLAVENNPTQTYGVVELRDAELQTDTSLFIVHHPEGEPQRISRFGCRALLSSELQANEFKHRCVTQGGSSGALIFADEDPPRPVGLHFNGGRDVINDPDSYNVAKRLTRIVTQSQELSRIKAALSPLPLPDERLRALEDFVFRIQNIRASATVHFRGPSDTYELAAILIKQANHPSATTSQLSFNGVLHTEGTSHQGAILGFSTRGPTSVSGGPGVAQMPLNYGTTLTALLGQDVAKLAGIDSISLLLNCFGGTSDRCREILDRVVSVEVFLYVNEVEVLRRVIQRDDEDVQFFGDYRLTLNADILGDLQSVRATYEARAVPIR